MIFGIIIILILLIPILSIVLDSPVGRALAARLEPKERDDAWERVGRLEEEVEGLRAEVERLGEESRFLHQLLAEKPAQGKKLPPGEESD